MRRSDESELRAVADENVHAEREGAVCLQSGEFVAGPRRPAHHRGPQEWDLRDGNRSQRGQQHEVSP